MTPKLPVKVTWPLVGLKVCQQKELYIPSHEDVPVNYCTGSIIYACDEYHYLEAWLCYSAHDICINKTWPNTSTTPLILGLSASSSIAIILLGDSSQSLHRCHSSRRTHYSTHRGRRLETGICPHCSCSLQDSLFTQPRSADYARNSRNSGCLFTLNCTLGLLIR